MDFQEKMRRRQLLLDRLAESHEWVFIADGMSYRTDINTIRPGSDLLDVQENPTAQEVFLTLGVDLEILAQIFGVTGRGFTLSYFRLGECAVSDSAAWQRLADLLGRKLHLYQRVGICRYYQVGVFSGADPSGFGCSKHINAIRVRRP